MKNKLKALEDTPLFWIDSAESMVEALNQIRLELKQFPVLGVDLEYEFRE